jgi:hypothetical protein
VTVIVKNLAWPDRERSVLCHVVSQTAQTAKL